MLYSYNNKKIKELLEKRRLSKRKVRLALNMANDITVQRWIEGEDIYICRLIEFCNKFNFSLFDFIECDGIPINIENKVTDTEHEKIETPSNINDIIIQKEQAISEIKLQNQNDLFTIKEELYRQEIAHVREVSDLTVRIREEERIRQFEQHENDRLKYKAEMDELRTHTEQLLSEKDREISMLRQQINNLQLEYKELELSNGTSGSMYQTPIAVAEPKTSQYKKTRP